MLRTCVLAQVANAVAETVVGTGSVVQERDQVAAHDFRSDLDPALVTRLVGDTAFAIAKAGDGTPELAAAFVEVLMDGLRPRAR